MHLKSSNGPIDVLVCPEAEDQRSQSPSSSPGDYNPAIPVLGPSSGLEEITPTNTPPPRLQQQQQQQLQQPPDIIHHPHTPLTPHSHCMPHQTDINVTPQSHMSMAGSVASSVVNPSVVIDCPASELDISLSSTADVNADDLEGLMDSYSCGGALDAIDSSTLLPTADMGILSFESLSPPLQDEDFCFAMETTEGIQDLFDLVA